MLSGVALLCVAMTAAAQAPDRIATTAEALVANPLFFHGKRIVGTGGSGPSMKVAPRMTKI